MEGIIITVEWIFININSFNFIKIIIIIIITIRVVAGVQGIVGAHDSPRNSESTPSNRAE